MSKIRVENLDKTFDSLEVVFDSQAGRKDFLDEIGKFLSDRIVRETRSGKDLVNSRRQPGLSPGYVGYRHRLANGTATNRSRSGPSVVRPDGRFFRPSFSNLTLTGQLLRSVGFRSRPRLKQIEIFVSGSRNDGKTNSQVLRSLARRGREFLGVDDKGILRVRRMIIDKIRREFRKKGFSKK
jgi:hypothetical protein